MDHQRRVLAGIVPDRDDRLRHAIVLLEEDHFSDVLLRNLWVVILRYLNISGAVPSPRDFANILERSFNSDQGRLALYLQEYISLSQCSVSDAEWRYSLDALRDDRASDLTGSAIAEALEVLTRGKDIDGQYKRGHQDAREMLWSKLGSAERLIASEAPEGDLRQEAAAFRQLYEDRKSGKDKPRVLYGISELDKATGGCGVGELDLICGYAADGKSSMVAQLAWSACIQGKSVYFVTTETVREVVRRRIFARHSRMEKFGIPGGVSSSAIRNGSLSSQLEMKLWEAIDDFSSNPAYGRLHLAQAPRRATISYLESRLRRAASEFPVDLVIVDYLTLFRSDRPRQKRQEELNDLIQEAKVLAATFNSGQGVPMVSPWAMSQNAYKEALVRGEYSLANLAETSEAEKSSDMIISMLRLPDAPKEIKCQVLKNRDGESGNRVTLEADFASCYLGTKKTANFGSLLGVN